MKQKLADNAREQNAQYFELMEELRQIKNKMNEQ